MTSIEMVSVWSTFGIISIPTALSVIFLMQNNNNNQTGKVQNKNQKHFYGYGDDVIYVKLPLYLSK